MIKCTVCNKQKDPIKDFYVKDRKTGRKDTTCKACRIIKQREKVLGVTNDEYLRMYTHQKGKCGICRRRIYSRRFKNLAVDHCHETGAIRGLLCHYCNTGIGLLRDCPENLRRAIDWVEGIVRPFEQSKPN